MVSQDSNFKDGSPQIDHLAPPALDLMVVCVVPHGELYFFVLLAHAPSPLAPVTISL
jgi:hypothetical protein